MVTMAAEKEKNVKQTKSADQHRMMGDPKIHHAVRSDGARSSRKTKEHEEKKRDAECRWSSRGVAQQPRNLEKNMVNLITSSVGAWHTRVPAPTLGGTSDGETTRKQEKNEVERTTPVVKTVNL